MAVTSQPRAASSLEVPVAQWQQTGLFRPSVLRLVLVTIERSLVLKKLGSLQPDDRQTLAITLAAPRPGRMIGRISRRAASHQPARQGRVTTAPGADRTTKETKAAKVELSPEQLEAPATGP